MAKIVSQTNSWHLQEVLVMLAPDALELIVLLNIWHTNATRPATISTVNTELLPDDICKIAQTYSLPITRSTAKFPTSDAESSGAP